MYPNTGILSTMSAAAETSDNWLYSDKTLQEGLTLLAPAYPHFHIPYVDLDVNCYTTTATYPNGVFESRVLPQAPCVTVNPFQPRTLFSTQSRRSPTDPMSSSFHLCRFGLWSPPISESSAKLTVSVLFRRPTVRGGFAEKFVEKELVSCQVILPRNLYPLPALPAADPWPIATSASK